VYHEDADTVVPVGHGHHTAEIIPGAVLVTSPHDGHLSMMTKVPQVITDLLA